MAAVAFVAAAVTLMAGMLSWLDNMPNLDGARTREERYDNWASAPLRAYGRPGVVLALAGVASSVVQWKRRPRLMLAGAGVLVTAAVALVAAAHVEAGGRRSPPINRAEIEAFEAPAGFVLEKDLTPLPGEGSRFAARKWRGRGDAVRVCDSLRPAFTRWTRAMRVDTGPWTCKFVGTRKGVDATLTLSVAGVGYGFDGTTMRPLTTDEELVLDVGLSTGPSG